MGGKRDFVICATITILVMGVILGSSNLFESAEALKAKGVSTNKYGTATKGMVCGDKLCSEVTEDEKKAEDEKRLEEKIQQKKEEQKMTKPVPAPEKTPETPMENKDTSKTFLTNPSKFPTTKMIATIPSSGSVYTLIFQVCATNDVDMRAPEVVISSDSAVKNVKLNKIILKGTCTKTVSSIKANDSASLAIKVIDKTKLNKMIEKAEQSLEKIEKEIADINNQLQAKYNALTGEIKNGSPEANEINGLVSKLSELRTQKVQLKLEYYELMYIIKPN